jgi:SPP1 gp7 family putative phage head morphogenesis protein
MPDWNRWAEAQARIYEDAMERLGAGMARSAQAALVQAYQQMEGRLARLYNRAVADGGLSFALQRNQMMMAELEAVFERFQLPADLQRQVSESMGRAREFGRTWAQESLNEAGALFLSATPDYARELVRQSPAPADDWLYRAAAHREGLGVTGGADLRAAIAAQDLRRYEALRNYHAMARFNRTRDDVAEKIQNVISVNVAQGTSWRKVERNLRQVMGAASNRAGMVARTEIAAASGEAMRQEYEARGVEMVQFIAVMDSRTSDFCATRNRRIYRFGEIVVPLHPHCRSTLMPVSQRMIDRGFIDPAAEAKARAEGLRELEAAGRRPNYGPAPFEKSAGLEAPTPVWKPPAPSP